MLTTGRVCPTIGSEVPQAAALEALSARVFSFFVLGADHMRTAPGPRQRALDAIALMRREGLSLSDAAARAGTSPRVVVRHASAALDRRGGNYVVREFDDLPRRMSHLEVDGPRWVTVNGSREASRLAAYHNDVKRFISTGDERAVLRWQGSSFEAEDGPHEFLTDLDLIEDLALGGELEYDVYLRGR